MATNTKRIAVADTTISMAETPRAVLFFGLDRLFLLQVRFRNRYERDDDERQHEDAHCDEKQGRYVGHGRAVGDRAYECADEKRGQCRRKRIQRAAGLEQLVAFVAAAAEDVEHRIDDRVQHADAESADERTQQIDDVVEFDYGFMVGEQFGTGTEAAGEVLCEQTDDTHAHGDEGSLFVTDAYEHVARRNAHEKIGQEVHHVAHHAESGVLAFPDGAHRGGQVRDERDHREEEEHHDDRQGTILLLLLCHFYWYSVGFLLLVV